MTIIYVILWLVCLLTFDRFILKRKIEQINARANKCPTCGGYMRTVKPSSYKPQNKNKKWR